MDAPYNNTLLMLFILNLLHILFIPGCILESNENAFDETYPGDEYVVWVSKKIYAARHFALIHTDYLSMAQDLKFNEGSTPG